MKKVLFCLLPLALLCVVSLTGCNLFDEKETSEQTSTEENPKDKESENEEKSKASTKDETEKSKAEKSETSNQASSSKENSVAQPKEAPKKETTSQVDWGDAWTRDIKLRHSLLEITEKNGNTFKFKIFATYAYDEAAARRGGINFGELEGTAKIKGNVATQTAPEPESDCQVQFTNYGTHIEIKSITDCSKAGGHNVFLDGDYTKGNIPPQIPMDDDQVESDEPSEDTSEVESDESSENTGEVENNETSEVDEDNWEDEETGQYDENTDWDDGYTEEEDDGSITMEEAQSIVEDYLQPDSNHFVEYSSISDGDYLFSYNADGDEVAGLVGIYGVNSETREVYKVQ
ncbi:hypothetical protein [Priestia megaterium]|uniref:Lipoprotein n=1 Tax=Priestia megaterium TaxID=1404 RepID=A0A6M6DYE9_PRIMG|nr:hypothetical protein [Priestia megaterium]QJX79941.1 hypothetical protein FDZ14_27965 [Priestia megaterium]